MDFIKENFTFLRIKSGLNQMKLSTTLGFSKGAWNNYEKGKSVPSLGDFMKISKYFGYSASALLESDLQNVHLNKKTESKNIGEIVHPIVHPSVHLNTQKAAYSNEITINVIAEPTVQYGEKSAIIPITDISVAAGAGHYNNDHIETVDALHLPPRLIKPGKTYLCVKIKGVSMAPTLQDGGYVIIRQLHPGEWSTMHDERIFVVSDKEGKSYLKRVKNRFKQGFIVLRSDSPDQATYPTVNMPIEDINSIWYVEWYFSAKMPNIHDQFYSRLQQLEDKVDDLASKGK